VILAGCYFADVHLVAGPFARGVMRKGALVLLQERRGASGGRGGGGAHVEIISPLGGRLMTDSWFLQAYIVHNLSMRARAMRVLATHPLPF
jgi:hypothetical protein